MNSRNKFLGLVFVAVTALSGGNLFAQSQLEQVRKNELQRNYNNCITGIGYCNKNELTHSQAEEASKNELRRNFNNCSTGIGYCNLNNLNTNELQIVKSNQLRRNLNNCNTGIGYCDKSVLTVSELSTVEKNELRRNHNNCLTGIGYCDKSKLTVAEAESTRKNELQRNLNNCLTGIGYCNKALLDQDSQSYSNKHARSSGSTATLQDTTGQSANNSYQALPRTCAENGSCYGDISDITGLPKTIPVDGYYRKDGTYVRGHYRSRK
jgi:hypothetical protein